MFKAAGLLYLIC